MATLSLTITNNSTHKDDDVYVGFVAGQISAGTPQPIDITYGDNQSIISVNVNQATPASYPFAGNWYRLDALAGGLAVKTFSGRIYVAYGQPWAPQGAFYEPAQSVTDTNFFSALRQGRNDLHRFGLRRCQPDQHRLLVDPDIALDQL